MTKELHKGSLRKVDNPHQWMIDDAKMLLLQQIQAEVERLKKNMDNSPLATEQIAGYLFALADMQNVLDTLQEQPICETCTNYKGCVTCKDGNQWEGQPVCEDLEVEMDRVWFGGTMGLFPRVEKYEEDFRNIARHFYELGQQSKRNIEICPHSTKSKSFSMRKEQSKPKVSEDVEEAAEVPNEEGIRLQNEYTNYLAKGLKEGQERPIGAKWMMGFAKKKFIEGATWQKDKNEAITDSVKFEEGFKTGREVGAREQKEQMMKEAVEGEILARDIYDKRALDIDFVYPDGLKPGDKVRIIIVKED